MKINQSNIKHPNIIKMSLPEILYSYKLQILDSFTAGAAAVIAANYLDGIGKILGCILTIILVIRGFLGIYKDRLETKGKKLENKLKEKQIKELERDEIIKETDLQA
jgi:hypothetical protein